ncbi:MAG TPA: class I SAM-dependent methyltransferase [Thermoanaerobaculia bacterium]|nr:class I SAM-dependent methyltransferase [Thermoanaerobaculia bacterium]
MPDDRYIDAPPAGADGWREVFREDRQYRPGGSFIARWLRGLVRRAMAPDAERQKNFNLVLLDLLDGLRGDIEAARRDLRGDIESVQRDVRAADEALANELAKLRELIPVAARRNDALIAALDQKIETLAVRIRDVVNPVVASSNDYVYRRLEDALRGSEAEVRADVAHYVRLAMEHQPVLDAGCGRGEFLASCRDAGIAARGVDTNERSVADLKARGFEAALAGVPECFASIGDGSLGAVLAMHVVEHLPAEALFALFRESARVLRTGGLLMIETPNAESIVVSASDFWRDPTHLAPRHAAALTVLAREHGFAIDEVRAVHELPEGTRIPILESDAPELQRVIHAINDRLFAPQDLRLILRRT